ncbi:LysE family transporter [Escherichia coli]
MLKWAGAAYLIWLGIQQWRAAAQLNLDRWPLLNRVDICSSAQFCESHQYPKVLCFWRRYFRNSSCRNSRN